MRSLSKAKMRKSNNFGFGVVGACLSKAASSGLWFWYFSMLAIARREAAETQDGTCFDGVAEFNKQDRTRRTSLERFVRLRDARTAIKVETGIAVGLRRSSSLISGLKMAGRFLFAERRIKSSRCFDEMAL